MLTLGASKGGEKKNIALLSASTDRILVPDDSQFLALVTCGQIGTLFFHRDDIEVAVPIEISELNQVVDESFGTPNGSGLPRLRRRQWNGFYVSPHVSQNS